MTDSWPFRFMRRSEHSRAGVSVGGKREDRKRREWADGAAVRATAAHIRIPRHDRSFCRDITRSSCGIDEGKGQKVRWGLEKSGKTLMAVQSKRRCDRRIEPGRKRNERSGGTEEVCRTGAEAG